MRSNFRTTRSSLLAAVLGLATMAALAAATYTPEERKLVDKVPQMIEAGCLGQVEQSATKELPQMQAMRGPNGVCACLGAEVKLRITPEVIRGPDVEQQVRTISRDANTVCVSRMMRASFRDACPSLMENGLAKYIGGQDINTSKYVPSLCACAQRRMDALTPADVRLYMQALATFKGPAGTEPGLVQSLPPAFASDMRECGLKAVNQMIDTKTSAYRAQASAAAAATNTPSATAP